MKVRADVGEVTQSVKHLKCCASMGTHAHSLETTTTLDAMVTTYNYSIKELEAEGFLKFTGQVV